VAAAALVNGQPILLGDYEAEVGQALSVLSQQQSFDPDTDQGRAALQQLRHQILDAMIDQALIEQAADREGITVSEQQVEDELARLVGEDATQFEDWLEANDLTREAFALQLTRQLLSAAVQQYVLGSEAPLVEQVHARHILVSGEEEAIALLLRIQSGESFSELAQEHSKDESSSALGGDLGFFPRNVMPSAIESAAFGLSPGQISGVVKTGFGFHIIEVIEKDPSRQVPEDMLAAWRQNTFLGWLEAHRAVAKVKYLIPMED
jgi:parvulin-like peptidyl-prolyl isomerase